ncbi:MAG: signal peptidase II [Clostridium sp.]|nr:signal peptidase II [Clostridium sp.]
MKGAGRMRKLPTVILLVLIDLLIKLIIHFDFMEMRFTLFNFKIGFKPYLNKEQLAIFNNELPTSINKLILIALLVVVLIIWLLLYNELKDKAYFNSYLELTYVFSFAGMLCALMDKLFFDGSLDYILLYVKIIDLKDLYLFSAIVCSILNLGYCYQVNKRRT